MDTRVYAWPRSLDGRGGRQRLWRWVLVLPIQVDPQRHHVGLGVVGAPHRQRELGRVVVLLHAPSLHRLTGQHLGPCMKHTAKCSQTLLSTVDSTTARELDSVGQIVPVPGAKGPLGSLSHTICSSSEQSKVPTKPARESGRFRSIGTGAKIHYQIQNTFDFFQRLHSVLSVLYGCEKLLIGRPTCGLAPGDHVLHRLDLRLVALSRHPPHRHERTVRHLRRQQCAWVLHAYVGIVFLLVGCASEIAMCFQHFWYLSQDFQIWFVYQWHCTPLKTETSSFFFPSGVNVSRNVHCLKASASR